MSDLATRLKTARKQANKTQAQVAEAVGMKQPSYQALEAGKNHKTAFLVDIANFLNVDVYWLQTGETNEKSNAKLSDKKIDVWTDGDQVPDGMIPISYYRTVMGSMGNGYNNDDHHQEEKLWFRVQTINDCNVNPNHAKAITVTGDSMSPELADGQVIAIDTSATRIFDGEIYAYIKNGELKVKYLFKTKDGFKAVSRNDDKLRYPDEIYTTEDIESENIQILGQYWWKSETRRIRR